MSDPSEVTCKIQTQVRFILQCLLDQMQIKQSQGRMADPSSFMFSSLCPLRGWAWGGHRKWAKGSQEEDSWWTWRYSLPSGRPGAEVTLCILGSPSTFLSLLLEGGVQSPGECMPKFPTLSYRKGSPALPRPYPKIPTNLGNCLHSTGPAALSRGGFWESLTPMTLKPGREVEGVGTIQHSLASHFLPFAHRKHAPLPVPRMANEGGSSRPRG